MYIRRRIITLCDRKTYKVAEASDSVCVPVIILLVADTLLGYQPPIQIRRITRTGEFGYLTQFNRVYLFVSFYSYLFIKIKCIEEIVRERVVLVSKCEQRKVLVLIKCHQCN